MNYRSPCLPRLKKLPCSNTLVYCTGVDIHCIVYSQTCYCGLLELRTSVYNRHLLRVPSSIPLLTIVINTDKCGHLYIPETDIQKKPEVYYSVENVPFNTDSGLIIDHELRLANAVLMFVF